MGRPKRLYPCSKWDGQVNSVQLSLNSEANGVLLGQATKLRELGDQIGRGIVLDIQRHLNVPKDIRIFKQEYSNILWAARVHVL
jgi:hypothetical protein